MVNIFPSTVWGIQRSNSKIQKYLEVLKQKLKNNEFGDIANRGEKYPPFSSVDQMSEVIPDGHPLEIAVGPGNSPKQLHLTSKREGDPQQEYGLVCKESEWFVFVDDIPACGEKKFEF